jgi:hypothetical protein
MWIAYAILAAAALVMSAALALHKWECRRYVRGTNVRSPKRTSPLPAVLIVPCKGSEVRQEENLRAFFGQQGVCFILRFVVEDAGDPAARLIVRLQEEYPHVVRPSRSFKDLELKSVKKKLKDKTFCEAIDRDALKRAADDLGVPLDKHIENVISFLRPVEAKLGLGKAAK